MKRVTNVCDRCGAEIDGEDSSWLCKSFMNIHVLHANTGILDGVTNVDLCPKCRKSFERWMRSGGD